MSFLTIPNPPLVTAVIPTRNRPDLVCRAVASALSQTFADLEVVVVVDGPDPYTVQALRQIEDHRLRVIALDESVGGADARNTGVGAGRGQWIAFLDDDDEWLPEKLERQLISAASAGVDDPIISCRFLARSNSGDLEWPKRLPADQEPISEYLLTRRGVRRDDGFIQTTTILTTRRLLLRVPFRSGLRRHQDWDWVLRASSDPQTRLIVSPEVLAVWNIQSADSVSRRSDWRTSFSWIQEARGLVTPRAYAGFICVHVAWQAAAQRQWSAFFPLLLEASSRGRIAPVDLVNYVGFWLCPPSIRRWAHARASLGGQQS